MTVSFHSMIYLKTGILLQPQNVSLFLISVLLYFSLSETAHLWPGESFADIPILELSTFLNVFLLATEQLQSV